MYNVPLLLQSSIERAKVSRGEDFQGEINERVQSKRFS